MANWNATVMGGDTPLDIEGNLLVDVCGIAFDDYIDMPIASFRDTFNIRLPTMVEYIDRMEVDNDDERNIAYQVLGVLLMRAGSDFPESIKALVVNAANKDKWAFEGDEARINSMSDLVNMVLNYKNGEPIEI